MRRKYAIAAKYAGRCLFSELKKHFFYPRQKTERVRGGDAGLEVTVERFGES